jgi:hypothetical protein
LTGLLPEYIYSGSAIDLMLEGYSC